ncbi:UNVERIFIED_CONTAM: hypothetical protein FKN15_018574 [Acipenser sinensis]
MLMFLFKCRLIIKATGGATTLKLCCRIASIVIDNSSPGGPFIQVVIKGMVGTKTWTGRVNVTDPCKGQLVSLTQTPLQLLLRTSAEAQIKSCQTPFMLGSCASKNILYLLYA